MHSIGSKIKTGNSQRSPSKRLSGLVSLKLLEEIATQKSGGQYPRYQYILILWQRHHLLGWSNAVWCTTKRKRKQFICTDHDGANRLLMKQETVKHAICVLNLWMLYWPKHYSTHGMDIGVRTGRGGASIDKTQQEYLGNDKQEGQFSLWRDACSYWYTRMTSPVGPMYSKRPGLSAHRQFRFECNSLDNRRATCYNNT